jgi:hypothetical protein
MFIPAIPWLISHQPAARKSHLPTFSHGHHHSLPSFPIHPVCPRICCRHFGISAGTLLTRFPRAGFSSYLFDPRHCTVGGPPPKFRSCNNPRFLAHSGILRSTFGTVVALCRAEEVGNAIVDVCFNEGTFTCFSPPSYRYQKGFVPMTSRQDGEFRSKTTQRVRETSPRDVRSNVIAFIRA